MASRLPAGSSSLGWQHAPGEDPTAFYRGEMIKDESTHSLCQQIRDRIQARLNSRIRDLRVEMSGDDIVISGRCANFHTKQLAQHAALDGLKNTHLDNRIEVLIR